MALDPFLLSILVCPDTKQPVRLASEAELESLNARVQKGEIKSLKGEVLGSALTQALIRDDGKIAYRVENDIPVMLIEEALAIAN
jgi:uncharacterized protein YbaR (Trm112 family)